MTLDRTMDARVPSKHEDPGGDRLADQIARVIEARHTDPSLDVNAIARALHVSRRHLYRHTPGGRVAALLDARRIMTACDLLVSRPGLSIAEVAARAGFGLSTRMRSRFATHVGTSPAQYRRDALRRIAHFSRTIGADAAGPPS